MTLLLRPWENRKRRFSLEWGADLDEEKKDGIQLDEKIKDSDNQPDGNAKSKDTKENKKPKEPKRLKTKTVPAVVMLMGTAATAVFTFLRKYSLKDELIAIFVTMIIFLILGNVAKIILDRFELADKEAIAEDGEVIEKKEQSDSSDSKES